MKSNRRPIASQIPPGEVQLARLQFEKAGARLKSAKAHARLARRRRKEARQAARRAKKQAKQAKREFAEAQEALAQAEAKLVRSRKRTVRTKSRKATVRKTTVSLKGKKAAGPTGSRLQRPSKPQTHQPAPAKRASKTRSRVRKAAQPIAVPRDFETPAATATPGSGQVIQTEKVGAEALPDKAAAGSPVEPNRQTQ